MNGATDDVTIDGHRFDRSGMARGQRSLMAMMVMDALFFPGWQSGRNPRNKERRNGKHRAAGAVTGRWVNAA